MPTSTRGDRLGRDRAPDRRRGADHSPTPSAHLHCAYDLDGNRTSRTDGTVTTGYAYARSDELVRETSGGTSTDFAYDPLGNLVAKAGNDGVVTTMAYADGQHLTGLAVGSDPAASLAYDALGRLDRRTASGMTETYAYAGTGDTIRRIDDGVSVRTSLVDGAGARLSLTTGTTTRWTLFDALGSLVGLIDPDGSLAETYRTDGYGQALRGTDQTPLTDGARNPFRFRGAHNIGTDAEPLYTMGARAYAPSAGAWTSMDTVAGSAADPAGMNRFLYVEGNPSSLVDPTGHMARDGQVCDRRYDDCTGTHAGGTAGAQTGMTSAGHGAGSYQHDQCSGPTCTVATTGKSYVAPPQAPDPAAPSWVRAEATSLRHDAAVVVGQALADELYLACNAAGANGYAEAAMGGCQDMVNGTTGHDASAEVVRAHDAEAAGLMAAVLCVAVCAGVAGAVAGSSLVGDVVAGGKVLLAGGGATQACIASNCVSRGLDAVAFALEASGAVPVGAGAAYAGVSMRLAAAADAESQAARLLCSFSGDTAVATPAGSRPIGELEPGDEVLAGDPDTGASSVRRVAAVLVHEDAVTGTVTIDGERIQTTPEHPFRVEGRGFVPAGELVAGDRVETASGTSGTVGAATWDGGRATMWNLTVAVDHTFFVGQGRWWVHNACGDSIGLTFGEAQLQAKFKHATDFGVSGNNARSTQLDFMSAIVDHIESPSTIGFSGTSRGTEPVIHFVDPQTLRNVFFTPEGGFRSGWKLDPKQYLRLLATGDLR